MTRSEAARRGARLTREQIFRAAVDLADREGLEACAMRRLADELGVGVMSLYYYVSGKDDLIAGMVEVVFSEIEIPPSDLEWKTAMRRRAISMREALNRHRWAVGLMESRALPGPQSFRVHDAVLGILREAGFSLDLTIQAYSILDAYIYGFALQEKTVPFDDAAGAAAVATEQVREFEARPEAQQLAEQYPYLADVIAGHVAQVGYDFGHAFEYGLDLILDALEEKRSDAR
ncbi:MAG TPA: TetR/AcrR family transcriptional regulator C-terminal domain-containing protein [Gaiellaceae bacterium]|nr:TetR/AcrR family transcriptional regulator C-terminal domain-containing protein [Gaiellaceae bacterium]